MIPLATRNYEELLGIVEISFPQSCCLLWWAFRSHRCPPARQPPHWPASQGKRQSCHPPHDALTLSSHPGKTPSKCVSRTLSTIILVSTTQPSESVKAERLMLSSVYDVRSSTPHRPSKFSASPCLTSQWLSDLPCFSSPWKDKRHSKT